MLFHVRSKHDTILAKCPTIRAVADSSACFFCMIVTSVLIAVSASRPCACCSTFECPQLAVSMYVHFISLAPHSLPRFDVSCGLVERRPPRAQAVRFLYGLVVI